MYVDKLRDFIKKIKLKNFVFAYILLMSIVPIVSRLTSKLLTTYFYMAIVVMTTLFILGTCRIHRIKSLIQMLLPFIIYALLGFLTQPNDGVLLAGYQVVLFLFPVFIGFYLTHNPFFVELHSGLIIAAYFFSCLTTIVGCITNPEAARILASTATSQDATAIRFEMLNIGGYGFVYSAVLLYPFVILAFKMKKLHLVFVIIISVVLFYLTIQAEYTFALLLMMLSTLLFFVKRDIPVKKFILLMLGFVVVVLLFRVTIAAVLTYFGNMIGNDIIVNKINAAFLGKAAVENFDDNRDELYRFSFQLFLQNPLLGLLPKKSTLTGGHSFILDNLALYGSLGGVLMVFMYRNIFRTFYLPLRDKPGFAFLIWSFLQTLILSAINTGMWLNNLCVFTPILICAIYGHDVYLKQEKKLAEPAIPVKALKSKKKELQQ